MHLVNQAGHVLGAVGDFIQAQTDPGGPTALPPPPVESQAIGPQTSAGENAFSFVQLFLKADVIGKSIMIILVTLSFFSWAIIVEKFVRLRALEGKADDFEQGFWSGRSLEDLYHAIGLKPDHPFAVVFVAAMREWRRNFEGGVQVASHLAPSIRDRIDRVMNVTIGREMTQVERQLGFLATVGSTAPFIGLFGTVWGIMNSFRGIAASNDTSLAVVAPGIAEALFATALGLFAAIPAVIFYNRFIAQANHYAGRLEGFADEFSAILSRQLDERAA
ncbi:MAG: protein TolQ [Alphaproteobacteria bacterium]|nr:protein TolQ [Alphaproteobacteria bacterium]